MVMPAATTLLAWTRLLRAAECASQHCADTLRKLGLPPPEWYDVLLALERSGAQRPRDLQAALGVEQYAISRLLDRMVKAGLLERRPCPDDARGHTIRLTIEGLEMRAAMWPVYAEAIEVALGARVAEEDRTALARLLAPLAEPVSAA
ncbi:MarR family transcriptional regulator [Novosphingobium sediminis]|uniref:MarR family transcriptional regulator n=1 Tax=Novosphingobium sediminis TaxID=707214 RepID=A0A512AFM6_9SPHN|nr:MarR family winged helix-turn-helix transcriptional regulator [Novosphingobium sediminis]GEN98515.1 MarR family transcriptional regulator [Novosphingobium sediminis]